MCIRDRLYSDKQKENETVEIFVAWKTQIYSRVHSPATEIPASLIPLLITQLKEELWKHLVTISFNNIDELIARASNLEREFVTRPNSNQPANEKNHTKKPESSKEKINPFETKKENANKPPPCQYCPERHYHWDCPVLMEWIKQRKTENKPENKAENKATLSTIHEEGEGETSKNSVPVPRPPTTQAYILIVLNGKEVIVAIDTCALSNYIEIESLPHTVDKVKSARRLLKQLLVTAALRLRSLVLSRSSSKLETLWEKLPRS